MQSKATTVEQYLKELPADRREAISAVRKVILKNLDKGFEEGMQYGAIGYYVPHRIFPAGYHCDPKIALPFAGLGSQKHHMSVGLMCHYNSQAEGDWFRKAWLKTGKKLDMGACCIRFKKLEDVPLEVLGEAFRRVSAAKYIKIYEAALAANAKRRVKGKPGAKAKASAKVKKKKKAG